MKHYNKLSDDESAASFEIMQILFSFKDFR